MHGISNQILGVAHSPVRRAEDVGSCKHLPSHSTTIPARYRGPARFLYGLR